jgi:hypothetical protein
MSMLRSATDELRAQDLRALGDDDLASDLDEIERVVRVLEGERARRLAEFERRRAHENDGFLSVSAWLVARHRVAPSTATRRIRMARSLEAMPQAAQAFSGGELSDSAVGLLASARESFPDAFARCEDALLQAARTLPVAALRSVIEYWRRRRTSRRRSGTKTNASSSATSTSPRRSTAWCVSTAISTRRRGRV